MPQTEDRTALTGVSQRKAVVLLSGGLDSTTVLAIAQSQGFEAYAMSFRYGQRHVVRPGLTGLWQVSGRADLTWEESVRMDLRYVDNWSIALDLQILWKTARAVLKGSGAY